MKDEQCAFCGRIGEPGTHGHHVVPRCKKGTVVVQTCGACGSFIHKTWSHNELRDVYNTVEIIQADERFKTFLKWRLKQKAGLKFSTERRNGRDKGKFR